MKRLLLLIFLLGGSSLLPAQTETAVLVDFSELLYYTVPLYLLTAASLGLFLFKLIRPQNPLHRWIYLTIGLGLIGGLLLTFQMDSIRDTQMTGGDTEQVEVSSEAASQEQDKRSRERADLTNAAFWMVSIPNIILLALSLIVDLSRRNSTTEPTQGRMKRYKD